MYKSGDDTEDWKWGNGQSYSYFTYTVYIFMKEYNV